MNHREAKAKVKYEAEGWRVLRNGAPDFLLLKVSESGEILEIEAREVKNPRGRLTYEQAVYQKVFEKAGIPYKVDVVE